VCSGDDNKKVPMTGGLPRGFGKGALGVRRARLGDTWVCLGNDQLLLAACAWRYLSQKKGFAKKCVSCDCSDRQVNVCGSGCRHTACARLICANSSGDSYLKDHVLGSKLLLLGVVMLTCTTMAVQLRICRGDWLMTQPLACRLQCRR
jgi:hypothetical protein